MYRTRHGCVKKYAVKPPFLKIEIYQRHLYILWRWLSKQANRLIPVKWKLVPISNALSSGVHRSAESLWEGWESECSGSARICAKSCFKVKVKSRKDTSECLPERHVACHMHSYSTCASGLFWKGSARLHVNARSPFFIRLTTEDLRVWFWARVFFNIIWAHVCDFFFGLVALEP